MNSLKKLVWEYSLPLLLLILGLYWSAYYAYYTSFIGYFIVTIPFLSSAAFLFLGKITKPSTLKDYKVNKGKAFFSVSMYTLSVLTFPLLFIIIYFHQDPIPGLPTFSIYKEVSSPDGKFKIRSKISNAPIFAFPGQGGDTNGYIELLTQDNQSIKKWPTELWGYRFDESRIAWFPEMNAVFIKGLISTNDGSGMDRPSDNTFLQKWIPSIQNSKADISVVRSILQNTFGVSGNAWLLALDQLKKDSLNPKNNYYLKREIYLTALSKSSLSKQNLKSFVDNLKIDLKSDSIKLKNLAEQSYFVLYRSYYNRDYAPEHIFFSKSKIEKLLKQVTFSESLKGLVDYEDSRQASNSFDSWSDFAVHTFRTHKSLVVEHYGKHLRHIILNKKSKTYKSHPINRNSKDTWTLLSSTAHIMASDNSLPEKNNVLHSLLYLMCHLDSDQTNTLLEKNTGLLNSIFNQCYLDQFLEDVK